jgi:hypothetical protein
MNIAQLEPLHASGLTYDAYLATDPAKAEPWNAVYEKVELTEAQRRLLGAFTREMRVLCVSGIWCGDCAQQGPLLQRIAEGSPRIDLRWIDRDEHRDAAETLAINAGLRVPVAIFMAEDYEPVSFFGDRTLTRYRALAARQLGGACPLPGATPPADELATTLQDWLDEFERVHLLLRLSGRLRQKYGD